MLSVSLEAPASVAMGTQVTFRLTVRNTSGQRVDLYLRGRVPTLDVVVARESGDVVWRSLDGQVIPAVLQIHSLAPGEKLEVSTVSEQLTAPGAYVARASLLAEDESIDAPEQRFLVLGARP